MVSQYSRPECEDVGAKRQSNATVDIPSDVRDALKKFRFKKSTSNSAISGMSNHLSVHVIRMQRKWECG